MLQRWRCVSVGETTRLNPAGLRSFAQAQHNWHDSHCFPHATVVTATKKRRKKTLRNLTGFGQRGDLEGSRMSTEEPLTWLKAGADEVSKSHAKMTQHKMLLLIFKCSKSRRWRYDLCFFASLQIDIQTRVRQKYTDASDTFFKSNLSDIFKYSREYYDSSSRVAFQRLQSSVLEDDETC